MAIAFVVVPTYVQISIARWSAARLSAYQLAEVRDATLAVSQGLSWC